VGVEKGTEIIPIDNPFRYRIAIWGSSFTHGASTSRAGMAYPAPVLPFHRPSDAVSGLQRKMHAPGLFCRCSG
jgi:hypothetical protein